LLRKATGAVLILKERERKEIIAKKRVTVDAVAKRVHAQGKISFS
jgi:hypothetical protein